MRKSHLEIKKLRKLRNLKNKKIKKIKKIKKFALYCFFLHCTSFFDTVFRKHCTALSQSELRIFFSCVLLVIGNRS